MDSCNKKLLPKQLKFKTSAKLDSLALDVKKGQNRFENSSAVRQFNCKTTAEALELEKLNFKTTPDAVEITTSAKPGS